MTGVVPAFCAFARVSIGLTRRTKIVFVAVYYQQGILHQMCSTIVHFKSMEY